MRARRHDGSEHGEPGKGALVEVEALVRLDETQPGPHRRRTARQRAPLALLAPDGLARPGVTFHQVGMSFAGGGFEQLLALGIGLELDALADIQSLELAHHAQVTWLHRFFGDHPRDRVEETCIEWRDAVVHLIGHVQVTVGGRRLGAGQRIHLETLEVIDATGKVRRAGGLGDDPQQAVIVEGGALHRYIACGHLALVARGQQHIARTLALVLAETADVDQRNGPGIQQAAIQSRTGGGRDVDHHRAVLEVDEQHHVDRRMVWRGGLVFPVRGPGPVHHIVVLRPGVTEIGLAHGVEIGQGHAPDYRLDSAALKHAGV
ncbi:hypothetical protein D3C76_778370 [compost metagenome]